ncbi:uncharacterized protein [Lepeophtheirus salmonis]|uniref:uncharacterized protein n=1 Tax=Lepeophtheirus salmonis TaxID=72036 RepID=UPI001AE67DB5|nr:ataxin-2-like protein [Lepeophtheirus salmonis]
MSCEKGKSRTEGPKNLKLLGNEFGLWKNSRFAHTVSSLVGVNVCVETANDGTYEGILRTISRFLDVVLLDSHLVDEKNCEDIRADTLVEKRVFEAKDIVRLVALDVDLEYATKKAFQTDHQISGKSNGPMRELEEWKPEDGDCQELEGGLETSNNGWKPEEMFAKNEQNYGVKSTYKDNLEGYTCQLNSEGKDSAEYKQREAKAAEIARQIESNASSLSAVDLENGENENEEEAFSAVVRSASPPPSSQPQRVSNSYHRSNRESSSEEPSSSSNNSNKYIPPSRRGPKNTPPPSRSHNDRDNDNDFNHHHHNHHHHSHHHYAHGSNYNKGNQQEDKSQQQHYHNRHNNSNYNYSHRGDGKPRIAKTLSNPNNNKNSNHHHHNNNAIPNNTNNNNNNNSAANNNIVKNNKESPESKKKGSPVVTPSPELAVEKVEENEVIESSKRGPSPETKPRVHFSDQSPSNVALTTAASTAPSTTIPTTSSPSTKKSGLNPNAKEFVLNPNAKMFTSNLSRPPMSTTPSRPQTPATPVGTPATYTTQNFIPGYVHHIPTSTQPTRNRAQRDYPRPELTSPIQVAAATGSPLVPVSYPHHIPFQTQAAVAGTPHHHHQQHGVVMRMSGVLPHNFALAGASSLEPLNLGQSPGQQNQWTTAAVTTSQGPPPQQGNPQQPLTGTPPAPSHNPSPGPQVLFPLAMTQHQQHSQGNNQAPPVNSLAYTHHHHHHPSNAATFAATASHGSGHYPPNLLALPHTAVLSGHPPMIHPPMMPSQQGHVHGGVPLTTYIAPPTAVPGHQNHLLHSHLTQ